MPKMLSTKILLRNDNANNWTTNNPVLAKGELGVQIDTKKFKFGDGVTHWNNLDYGAGADIQTATSQSAGLMSAADYTKLASIAAGAQVNVQPDWNAVSGDAAILNKPITLAGYGIIDAMTATEIGQAISAAVAAAFVYKGTKATISALPTSGNKTGDVWHVTETNGEYAWNGSEWDELGSIIDLSGYLQSISIAGITLTPVSNIISADALKTALGLGAAAYKNVDTTISVGSTSSNVPTAAAVASYVATNSTKVEASNINGNIKVNNSDITVYTLPSSVVTQSDTLILECGASTTNYS